MNVMILALTLSALGCSGQRWIGCTKCDMELLHLSEKTKVSFSKTEITSMFCTMDHSCSNNAEFSEVSNEILFKIFINQPELALQSLSENAQFDLNYICAELTRPVNDGINVQEAYAAVSRVEGYDNVKTKVLKSFDEAFLKNK